MTIDELKKSLHSAPEKIEFEDVMETIAIHYNYMPCRFTNGKSDNQIINEAGINEGSCKIFSFGQLNNLDEKETLACFGKYYRNDVLAHPKNTDHANIRNFIQSGWDGIQFDGTALTEK